jgi:prepilin-type processing-associated H-X9-DG protein
MNSKASANTYNYDLNSQNWRGHRFLDGRMVHNGFVTIIPPNGPSCSSGSDDTYAIMPPSSNHTGGVNACLADGSVQFVSETVHTDNLDGGVGGNQVTSGPSPYGVWGALGTAAGGESKSL